MRLNDVLNTVEKGKREQAIAISGMTATLAFSDELLTKKLIHLLAMSPSVIVYRCSPDDKATIISKIMQQDPDAFTMAIGDGGNDVNMI